MQSILLEFELQPNWRASIVACKLPVLSALRRFSVLVGGRLAFRRIIRRKATTRASLHFQAFPNFRNNNLEMLARQQGQAIIIWRNTPACGVAET